MQRLLHFLGLMAAFAGVPIFSTRKPIRGRFVSGRWFNRIPESAPMSFGFRLAPARAAGQ
jgi:hypothetical protein